MSADFDIDFVAFQTLTAAEMDTMADNDRALLDWSAYAAGSFPISLLDDESVTAQKIDFASGVWWEELDRTTLGSAGDTITVSGFAARKYLRIIIRTIDTGGTNSLGVTFNGDTGNNYAWRESTGGAADTTANSQASFRPDPSTAATPVFVVMDIINEANQEKLIVSESVGRGTAGAANVPTSRAFYGKWANTSNQITTVTTTNGGAGDYATGSEIIVLGHN